MDCPPPRKALINPGCVPQWRDHMRHGLGVHAFADGAQYEGQWRQGTMHGFGLYVLDDGRWCGGAM